ncbi:MAG: hypothetical protein K2I10_03515 [Lachnospiraceae bacterium]|nr:hypothetical protein [Lachnospiraceae bacterium]
MDENMLRAEVNYVFLGCRSLYKGCKMTQIGKECCVIFIPVFGERRVKKIRKE